MSSQCVCLSASHQTLKVTGNPARTLGLPQKSLRHSVPGMPTIISRDEIRSGQGSLTVVDALPEGAYRRRHLPGALNLTEEDAADRAAEVLPDRSAPVVVYSTDRDCDRGPGLAARLEQLGYTDIRLYADGIEDWAGAGLPLDRS